MFLTACAGWFIVRCMENSTYAVRITSPNGIARTVTATAATADRIAAAESRYALEADVVVNGETVAAYIHGARVVW